MGHGRSYGQDSTVFGRKISGIFPCALWQDLQNRPTLPTAALVTDIGNDLLYGVPPDQLLEWVERCLDRLAEAGAATIVTQLPVGQHRTTRAKRDFDSFAGCFFRAASSLWPTPRRWLVEINDRLIAIGRDAKNPGNSSVGVVVRLRSDSSQAARRASTRGRRCSPRGACRCEPLAIARSSLWTTAYLATFGAVRAIRYSAFDAAQCNRAVACPTARRFHSIDSPRDARRIDFVRARASQLTCANDAQRGKIFAQSKIFGENVLHNFNNFVQLRTSDIGFHAFQLAIDRCRTLIRLRIEMRVTGATAER